MEETEARTKMNKEKVTTEAVRARIEAAAEEKYREFHSALVPGTNNVCGVRLPVLRKMAKELAKEDWQEWFEKAEDCYYEETMLRGFVIGYAKLDCETRLAFVQKFVPCIRSWGICDSFCVTLKDAKKYPERYWEFLEPYFTSEKEFEARFGAVMLLDYFVKKEYLSEGILRLESVRQEGYYAKMAVAWAVAEYFVRFPGEMYPYLESGHHLDAFTYRKALQKILESYRADSDIKNKIRELRQRG